MEGKWWERKNIRELDVNEMKRWENEYVGIGCEVVCGWKEVLKVFCSGRGERWV